MDTIRLGIALLAAATIVVPLTAPAASAAGSTVTVESATVDGSTLQVIGSVTWGTDATGDTVLATDPAGDATVRGIGLDLTGVSVRPNISDQQLLWTLTLADGIAALNSPLPFAVGYEVPIVMDDQEKYRWLAAGTAGTAHNQIGGWTGLCHNQAPDGSENGWSCPTGPGLTSPEGTYAYAGTVTATKITWTQPFGQMAPAINHGSVVSQGSALCGSPCSFGWPSRYILVQAPADTIETMASYLVPGKVQLAILPSGVAPTNASFTTTASFTPASGAFSAAVPKPAAGNYTAWARTCFGLAEQRTCAIGSMDLTL